MRTGLYIYSQAIPFGTLFPGTTFQFPLIWESLSVTFVMIPAAILVYRDDTGKSVAEKLAAKAKLFPEEASARHVPGDVRDHQRVVLRLRRLVLGDQGQRAGDVGRVPVAVSRGQGLRPAGLLRGGRCRRTVLGRQVVHLAAGAAGRPARRRTAVARAMGAAHRKGRMAEPRSVVITGASRGLGFASATRLYRRGLARGRCDANARSRNAVAASRRRVRARRRPADRRPARPDGLAPRSPPPPRRSKKPSARRTPWCTTQVSPPPEWWRRRTSSCGSECSPPT